MPPKPSSRIPWWPFLLLAVPVSSFFGLLRPMWTNGWDTFADVWGLNAWADLVFILGTVGAVWVSAWIASGQGRPDAGKFLGAVAAALALHAVVYIVSASLAGTTGVERSFFAIGFHNEGLAGVAEVLKQGMAGLAAMAFAGPLIGLFLPNVHRSVGDDASA